MPSFFPKSQRPRLLREHWETPKLLAEELYAMMGSTVPLDEKIEQETPGTDPAYEPDQLGDPDTFEPVIKFFVNGEPKGGIQYFPEDDVYKLVDKDGNPTTTDTDTTTASGSNSALPPQTVFIGKVIAKVSGDTYTCWLYTNSKDDSPIQNEEVVPHVPQEFTVRVVMIDTSEVIPAGSYFIVHKLGPIVRDGGRLTVQDAEYWMQAPVWLYPEP